MLALVNHPCGSTWRSETPIRVNYRKFVDHFLELTVPSSHDWI